MWLCYLIALLPVAVGAVLWVMSKSVVWWEWLLMSGAAFLTSGIFHLIAVHSMAADVETWSGQITHAVYEPEWVEKYKEAIYRTETRTRTVSTGSGKNRGTRTETYTVRVLDHYEDRYRTHPEDWTAYLNYGREGGSKGITREFYREIMQNFGGQQDKESAFKSGFYSGDPNIYKVHNHTGYVYPSTITKLWENKIKSAPSVFSYAKVPEKAPVLEYPANNNWRSSDRVMGEAKRYFDNYKWDCMNAKLGPAKKVNVIVIGFNSADSGLARIQEAKWIGGKKNDLVICFGGVNEYKPAYVYVFGWTEKMLVKRNLETIFLNNQLGNELLPEIEKEVLANYTIKDWSKFDYITVEPPWWSFVILFVVILGTQGGLAFFVLTNEFGKDGNTGQSRFGYVASNITKPEVWMRVGRRRG